METRSEASPIETRQPWWDDPQIVLRRILLNSLMKAPVPKERIIASARRQFGFTREDVLRAAMWWNCTEEMHDGEAHWCRPDVLVALPRWGYGRGGAEERGEPLGSRRCVTREGKKKGHRPKPTPQAVPLS